jgi:sugar phosphate isomerase/epimerase
MVPQSLTEEDFLMDMTRVSACTYPLINRPVEEAFAIIAEAGFKKVDLLGRLPHFDIDPEGCDHAARKALAKAHGLRIANLGTYLGRGFASPERAVQEAALSEVRQGIDLAVFFGARSIRLHFGEGDNPQYVDQLVPWLQCCTAYAAAKGVYLGVENHGKPLSGSPTAFRTLVERVGSPYFGLLYDPCNYASAGEDYRAALETLKDSIVHVHFKDGEMTAQGFQRTMLGEGDLDFVWIVEQLDAHGYAGDLALEYELKAPPVEVGLKRWYETFAAM